MDRPSRFVALLVAAGLAFVPLTARADLIPFVPPGYHFSVQFPATRTYDVSADTGLSRWKGFDDGFLYVAVESDPKGAFDTTFQADLKDFVTATNATIVEQHPLTWVGPSGNVLALRVEFRMPNGALGESEYTVENGHSVGLTVLDRSMAARRDLMIAFLDSLKFTD
jgi:hypothetical protein